MNGRSALWAPLAALLTLSACQPYAAPPAFEGPPRAPRADSALEVWLSQHPTVAGAIVWETERGPVPWTHWDDARRRLLEEAFLAESAALQGRGDPRGFPLRDPPPNLAASSRMLTVLSPDDAFRLYAAHVGHSLALEILHVVPWSIASDPPASLEALLDGRSMFTWSARFGGYMVDSARHGWVVPAPPSVELGFLAREHLLGPTRLATIEALVGWSARLWHVEGRLDLDNAERVWHYRGFAPVSRVLEGTGHDARRYVTAGCWGTTGLLISVLRSANVPVRLVEVRGSGGRRGCSHALPYFVSEGRFLSHGDDPYNRFVAWHGEGVVPPERILIDQATWTAWFGSGVDPSASCANVGRQVREIGLATLPPYLVETYCDDERRGVDHASGRVARAFGADAPDTAFPLSRLEREHLWERLAEKARATGACSTHAAAPAPAATPEEP